MTMTAKEIIKLLESHGFVFVSANGSHRKYRNPANGITVIVPYHGGDLKAGTVSNILKQAGLK